MGELDTELSERLARLAAAVPVADGQPDVVRADAVRARHRLRIAWVTPIVAVVVVAIGATLLARGNSPGTTSPPGETPTAPATPAGDPSVAATDSHGPFSFELRADKAHYAPGEPIDVAASLLYGGPEDSIQFQHHMYSGPITFGLREKVFGEIQLQPVTLMCICVSQSTLQRDVPLVVSFRKLGGFPSGHPDIARIGAWLSDPELWLPEGTWHFYASAEGAVGKAGGGEAFGLYVEIEIVVARDPAATPGLPASTDWTDNPVYGGADGGDGWVELQLKSRHARYEKAKPVEISAWYWFNTGGGSLDLVASTFAPVLGLSIEQLSAKDPGVRTVVYDNACIDMGLVEGKHIDDVPLGPNNVTSYKADVVPASFDTLYKDGALYLPVGRWRITASINGTFARCGDVGDPYEANATIEIEVVEHLD